MYVCMYMKKKSDGNLSYFCFFRNLFLMFQIARGFAILAMIFRIALDMIIVTNSITVIIIILFLFFFILVIVLVIIRTDMGVVDDTLLI